MGLYEVIPGYDWQFDMSKGLQIAIMLKGVIITLLSD